MKLYIYTIPKAGTYFLAGLLETLGYHNSGRHIFAHHMLDTHSIDATTNARDPVAAKVDQGFYQALRAVPDKGFAFGHFPVPMIHVAFPAYRFICGYRHPRKFLVSEFIDFRFRRTSVEEYSHGSIADDQAAFVSYLERRGRFMVRELADMITLKGLVDNEDALAFDPDLFCFVNFDQILRDPLEVKRLARFANEPLSEAEASDKLSTALSVETKTKATGLEIDRDALWSDAAEELYEYLGFEGLMARNPALNWTYTA